MSPNNHTRSFARFDNYYCYDSIIKCACKKSLCWWKKMLNCRPRSYLTITSVNNLLLLFIYIYFYRTSFLFSALHVPFHNKNIMHQCQLSTASAVFLYHRKQNNAALVRPTRNLYDADDLLKYKTHCYLNLCTYITTWVHRLSRPDRNEHFKITLSNGASVKIDLIW